jgi:hypothetical protein
VLIAIVPAGARIAGIASRMGRLLHGWRSRSPNDTGSPRKRRATFRRRRIRRPHQRRARPARGMARILPLAKALCCNNRTITAWRAVHASHGLWKTAARGSPRPAVA